MARPQPPLREVLLVVVLRAPELRGRLDLRRDRAAEAAALLELLARGARGGLLLGRVDEDDGAVLSPDVGALPVQLRRVVRAPEDVEQTVVRHGRGIELHLDDLRVAGAVRAHVVVGRVLERSSAVADCGVADALDLAELLLDSPEAARAERRLFRRLFRSHVDSSRASAVPCRRTRFAAVSVYRT